MAKQVHIITEQDMASAKTFVQTGLKTEQRYHYEILQKIIIYAEERAQSCNRTEPHVASTSVVVGQNATFVSSSSARRQVERCAELGRILKEIEDLEERNKQLEKLLSDNYQETEDAHQINQDIANNCGLLVEENERLKQRLYAAEKKQADFVQRVGIDLSESMDATRTENIAEKCRPSEIQTQYERLTLQDATTLKTSIRKPGNISENIWNIFIHKIVCSMLMISWTELTNLFDELFEHLSQCLSQPVRLLRHEKTTAETTNSEKNVGLSTQMIQNIYKSLLTNANVVQMDVLIEKIINSTTSKVMKELMEDGMIHNPEALDSVCAEFLTNNGIWTFAQSACQLAWQMALQKPKIKLVTDGIGEKTQPKVQKAIMPKFTPDLFKTKNDYVVYYYLEPTMVHGNQVMVPGRVVLHDPNDVSDMSKTPPGPGGTNRSGSSKRDQEGKASCVDKDKHSADKSPGNEMAEENAPQRDTRTSSYPSDPLTNRPPQSYQRQGSSHASKPPSAQRGRGTAYRTTTYYRP